MTLPQSFPADRGNWDGMGQIPWLPLSNYLNATNWLTYDTATWPAMIGKDPMNFVHLRGLVRSNVAYAFATPASLVIATLPRFLRPVNYHMGLFMQVDTTPNNSLIRFDVQPDGPMVIVGNSNFNAAGNSGIVSYAKMLIDPWYAPYQD